MIDPRVLKYFKTDNAQLRLYFTSLAAKKMEGKDEPVDPLYEKSCEFKKWLCGLIEEGRQQCFRNYRHYASVDLMRDSQPILPENIPLMAYAQGKIDVTAVQTDLEKLNCADKFIEKKNCAKQGEAESIKPVVNVARLHEVCVNVGRSFISRRANAQTNKYNSLRPFFKFDTRGTSMVDHLRGEAMSQYAEIMVDGFDYRHVHDQCVHGMFNYTTFLFPAGAWEYSAQTHAVADTFNGATVEAEIDGKKLKLGTKIEREGVRMVRTSTARVIRDTSNPPSSINTDSGCRWIGFFDVMRFGDVSRTAEFFNTDKVTWSTAGVSVLDQNRAYFDLIFPGQPINFPSRAVAGGTNPTTGQVDLAAGNEAKAQSFIYNKTSDSEKAVFVTDIRVKVIPKEWGMGDYPQPVWLRLLVASDDTVIFAEWLPSRPAIYWGYNEDDTRLLNISTAHEIMPWQDQLSNIFSQLLLKMKHSLLRLIVINKDVVGQPFIDALKAKLDGPGYYMQPHLVELSFTEAQRELGLNLDNVIKLIGAGEGTNANESEYINNAFKAIIQILAIMERLLNMSPQEQGQPAPREITAEEVAAIESTTQATYNAIGSCIDAARAAWKRIVYESAMAHASDQVPLPISQRFSKETIASAGFTVVDDPVAGNSNAKKGYTVIGTREKLVHDYVFTSRDGGDRASNRESANVLQQFLTGILAQIGPEALGKKRIFEIINEIFRLLSSYDLKLEMDENESDTIMAPQMQQQFAALQQELKSHEDEISGLGDAIAKIDQILKQMQPPEPQPVAA
jgi:hypothetical protein